MIAEVRRRDQLVRTLSALVAVAVLAGVFIAGTASSAAAADTSSFRPGNIISDSLFFDGGAMDAGAVAAFIGAKGASCRAGSDGTPCLKDFRQDTYTRAADAYCSGYNGAAGESAATIVVKVGQACGISQRVLLVLLQKEQGLVTTTGSTLTASRYRSATGFGCPDTAACDSAYYGFYNQVFMAARQYKVYAANPTRYGYRAGTTNSVRYSPNASCGSSQVYIENQATAGLYIYTPYQPNSAALSAGYGSGDGCSAYGNRNFWMYFTDWFGSTQSTGGAAVVDAATAAGASLGAAVSGVVCGMSQGGCGQAFRNGSVYWSAAGGAHAVVGPFYTAFAANGYELGVLGYPIADARSEGAGRSQRFAGGVVVVGQDGVGRVLTGAILAAWTSTGGGAGQLGLPSTGEVPVGDAGSGRMTTFDRGVVYWAAVTGVHVVQGAVLDGYRAAGSESGWLGFPTSDEQAAAGGVLQSFQNGWFWWSASSGAVPVGGAVGAEWDDHGGLTGPLGAPLAAEGPAGISGRSQSFAGGAVYWSPVGGARTVWGAIGARYDSEGGASSPLGLPTGSETSLGSGAVVQSFEGGRVFWRPSVGTIVVWRGVGSALDGAGGPTGPLGVPTAAEAVAPGGVGRLQTFTGGTVYWSPATGAQVVWGAVAGALAGSGGVNGPLGYPLTGEVTVPGGKQQSFQGGEVFWNAGTGGTWIVWGAVAATFRSLGGASGPLGLPVGAETVLSGGGVRQDFTGGSVFWSPTSGAYAVWGAIAADHAARGGVNGFLGFPTGPELVMGAGDARLQQFQRGWSWWSPTTGVVVMRPEIGAEWNAQGGLGGSLGAPVAAASSPRGTGASVRFQGGVLTLDATGSVIRS